MDHKSLSIGSRTILLAEDDAPLRGMIAEALRDEGWDVRESADGAEALRRYAEAGVAAVLLVTDVQIPPPDGIALAKALRATHPDLPVIFISAIDISRARDAMGEDSRTAFLKKPFQLAELRTTIARLARTG
jgi:CheY-like chemotaxis protein